MNLATSVRLTGLTTNNECVVFSRSIIARRTSRRSRAATRLVSHPHSNLTSAVIWNAFNHFLCQPEELFFSGASGNLCGRYLREKRSATAFSLNGLASLQPCELWD